MDERVGQFIYLERAVWKKLGIATVARQQHGSR